MKKLGIVIVLVFSLLFPIGANRSGSVVEAKATKTAESEWKKIKKKANKTFKGPKKYKDYTEYFAVIYQGFLKKGCIWYYREYKKDASRNKVVKIAEGKITKAKLSSGVLKVYFEKNIQIYSAFSYLHYITNFGGYSVVCKGRTTQFSIADDKNFLTVYEVTKIWYKNFKHIKMMTRTGKVKDKHGIRWYSLYRLNGQPY